MENLNIKMESKAITFDREAKEPGLRGNVEEYQSGISLPPSPKNHFDYQGMASLPCAATIAHMFLLLHVGHLFCICAKLHATLWCYRAMFFWKSFLASSLDA